MKTLFANNETFDSFSFDALTADELALVKGGKVADNYCDLN